MFLGNFLEEGSEFASRSRRREEDGSLGDMWIHWRLSGGRMSALSRFPSREELEVAVSACGAFSWKKVPGWRLSGPYSAGARGSDWRALEEWGF